MFLEIKLIGLGHWFIRKWKKMRNQAPVLGFECDRKGRRVVY